MLWTYNMASSQSASLIVQLVENCTNIAEVVGLNPVQALTFFFQVLISQLLKLCAYETVMINHFIIIKCIEQIPVIIIEWSLTWKTHFLSPLILSEIVISFYSAVPVSDFHWASKIWIKWRVQWDHGLLQWTCTLCILVEEGHCGVVSFSAYSSWSFSVTSHFSLKMLYLECWESLSQVLVLKF